MKLKVTLTEDMIKLISCLQFGEFKQIDDDSTDKQVFYALDMNSLYGGNFIFEDVSRILGLYDKRIENSEELSTGPVFPQEIEDYMWETHGYIVENLPYIEQIVHQFCYRGGITPGTYVSKHNELIWRKE
jgi:hypothetical protein